MWGLGVVVAESSGKVLGEMSARLEAHCASTTLLEATALVEATVAVHNFLVQGGQGEDIRLWRWCDNKGAVQILSSPHLDRPPGTITNALVSWDLTVGATRAMRVGWCPAQHDTGHQGVLSDLNSRADAIARGAVEGTNGAQWVVPRVWGEGVSMILFRRGVCVADTKRATGQEFEWLARPSPNDTPPLPEVESLRPNATFLRMWHKCSPLSPQDQAFVALVCRFGATAPSYVAQEGKGVCERCAQDTECLRRHRLFTCPSVQWGWGGGIQELVTYLAKVKRHAVVVERGWGGVAMHGDAGKVFLLFGTPWGAKQAAAGGGGTSFGRYTSAAPRLLRSSVPCAPRVVNTPRGWQ